MRYERSVSEECAICLFSADLDVSHKLWYVSTTSYGVTLQNTIILRL
jgi:hypothetical protein